MTKKPAKQKAYKEALTEFREKHVKELEINMQVAKEIRDDPKANKKDRNEAIKIISRMLGALQPDRTTTATAKASAQQAQAQKYALSPAEEARIDAILNE